MITRFEEVSFTSTKSGKCVVCGKRGTLTKKFYQTLNPYNRNPDGSTKDRSDIMRALTLEQRSWKAAGFIHDKCAVAQRKIALDGGK